MKWLNNEKSLLTLLLFSIFLSGVFTSFDYFVHQQFENIKVVPENYYVNKIVITTLLFFVLSKFKKLNVWIKSLIFNVFLNLGYFYTTNTDFFITTFIIHYLIALVIFYSFEEGGFF